MSKTALILVNDNTEDIELVVTSDTLRRANFEVTIAGIQDKSTITLNRGISLNVDKKFADVVSNDYDIVICPGGPGSAELSKDKRVGEVLKRHEKNGKYIAGICAGPLVLKNFGISPGAKMCAYPSAVGELKQAGYNVVEENVVVSDKCITSRGPGTTFDFALKIVSLIAGDSVSEEVRGKLLA